MINGHVVNGLMTNDTEDIYSPKDIHDTEDTHDTEDIHDTEDTHDTEDIYDTEDIHGPEDTHDTEDIPYTLEAIYDACKNPMEHFLVTPHPSPWMSRPSVCYNSEATLNLSRPLFDCIIRYASK